VNHNSIETFENPQLRSIVLPETLTVISDGLRVPTRGVRFWISVFGSGISQLNSKEKCALIFETSEQMMAFKFKFSINVVNGKMRFKHFSISEAVYKNSSAERAFLSSNKLQTVHYKLVFDARDRVFSIYGPEKSKEFEGKWSQRMFRDLPPGDGYTGGLIYHIHSLKEALEILHELRIIWVGAPIKLLRLREDEDEMFDITDQDEVFVALML
jgi:hypothetical protein